MIRAVVRLCPKGKPTVDKVFTLAALPSLGETIVHEQEHPRGRFVVAEVDWCPGAELPGDPGPGYHPFVVAKENREAGLPGQDRLDSEVLA